MIEGLLEAGAVGFNLEDSVHAEGGRLREPQEHADLVAALRQAADASGVHVVINARTDLLLRQIGDAGDRLDRAIALAAPGRRGRLPTCCTRSAATSPATSADSAPNCPCRSTRSACPTRTTRRPSPNSAWPESVSARSCSAP